MPVVSCSKRIIIGSLAMGALIFVVTAALIGILFGSYNKKLKEENWVDKIADKCLLRDFLQPDQKCPLVQMSTDVDDKFMMPSEQQIAADGHLLGIAPVHYNWTMNFVNSEKYVGKVSITLKTVAETKRIVLHANTAAFDIYYDTISVWSCTSSSEFICVEKVTVLQNEQALVLDMKQPLKAKGVYILTFSRFNGSVASTDGGSAGLRLSSTNSPVWAVTTIFQMRLARTVFPCFDHPSLKATFSICIEHSEDTEAYSNTAVADVQQAPGPTERILECYQRTPRIPTYVVTVSLLGNFSAMDDNSTSPTVEIFYPSTDTNDSYVWEFDQTRKVMEVFESFGLNYNLSKLGFINVNPSPFWGIENFGLVTLESGFTRFSDSERGKTIIIHEIIHQWLGDVATVSYWDEICLQEGLTAYIEMMISEKLKVTNIPLARQIRSLIGEYLSKDHTIPLFQRYNVTQDIADYCFGKPVVFLHTIAYGYGSDIWTIFLKKLIEKYPYSNANFNDWVNLVNEISGSTEPGEILTSLFKGSGYPIIFAAVQSQTQLKLAQKVFLNEGSLNKTRPFVQKSAIPVPIRLLTKDQLSPIMLMNSVTQVVNVTNVGADDWILLDPESATFSRKVYTVANYLALLECMYGSDRNNCKLEIEHLQDAFSDFCFALMEDQLPWGPDLQSDSDPANWEAVLEALRDLTSKTSGKKQLNLNRVCECCFRTKQELVDEKYAYWHPNACRSIWNDKCRGLNLMKVIGRDYLIPERQK